MPYETTALALTTLITICMFTIVAFLVASWPFYFFFVIFRRKQIHHPQYDALTTTPSHVALIHCFTAAYGVILPALSFIAFRSHHDILEWEFSRSVHTGWKMALASLAMAWLAARMLEAVLNRDRPRFAGWTDRIFAGLGVMVCLCYHSSLLTAKLLSTPHFIERALFYSIPQFCVLGTTLVYALALLEAAHSKTPIRRRRRKAAWAIAASGILFMLSPLLLAHARVSHGQAMKLIETHLDQINDAAAAAEVDPRLVAGVIYVAQTRDQPAVYGDAFSQLCISMYHQRGDSWARKMFPDPKLGLYALNFDQLSAILTQIANNNNLNQYVFDDAVPIILNVRYLFRHVQPKKDNSFKLPDALLDLIQASPTMDPVFNVILERREQQVRDGIKALLPIQWDAYRFQLFMPTIRFACGVSRPLQAMVNASSKHTGHNFNCFFLKDHVKAPIATEFIDMFPDRTRVLCPPSRQALSYNISSRDLVLMAEDAWMNILLGTAMLKMASAQAAAESPGPDLLAATIQKCPYARPADFARRLKKIMNSPEFARLFPAGS